MSYPVVNDVVKWRHGRTGLVGKEKRSYVNDENKEFSEEKNWD